MRVYMKLSSGRKKHSLPDSKNAALVEQRSFFSKWGLMVGHMAFGSSQLGSSLFLLFSFHLA
jgi:hypothetical protein